jgi:hypothetical protein
VADEAGSSFLGVLVGALVIVALFVLVAFGTGMFGSKETTVKLEAPKVSTSK